MEAGGITFKSAKDIKMEATAAFSIKAGTDFKIEGVSISGKASATLEMNGQASAKIASSAMLELQGGIVKIN
jgi:hypothetical protein